MSCNWHGSMVYGMVKGEKVTCVHTCEFSTLNVVCVCVCVCVRACRTSRQFLHTWHCTCTCTCSYYCQYKFNTCLCSLTYTVLLSCSLEWPESQADLQTWGAPLHHPALWKTPSPNPQDWRLACLSLSLSLVLSLFLSLSLYLHPCSLSLYPPSLSKA